MLGGAAAASAKKSPVEFAVDLMQSASPVELEAALHAQPALLSGTASELADALVALPAESRDGLSAYLAGLASARARRLEPDCRTSRCFAELAPLHLLDPVRFGRDASFRERAITVMEHSMPLSVSREFLDGYLQFLNGIEAVDFDTSERIELAWRSVRRPTTTRQTAHTPALGVPASDSGGPIDASIYSLSSRFFTTAEAISFLAAVRKIDAERDILVLADLPMRHALAKRLSDPRMHLLDTYGRRFSPWPRDSFLAVRDDGGRVTFVTRPNLQPKREEDSFLAREIIQSLPDSIDARWNDTRWARAGVPFHNGQVLITNERAWIDLHAVEIRALEILGLERVPVQTFDKPAGINRYVTAVKQSARELGELYGREVAFVHPLPDELPAAEAVSLMHQLGGGGGLDLDSMLTLVERDGAPPVAFVGDVTLGASMLSELTAAQAKVFRETFGFSAPPDDLAPTLARAQKKSRAAALDTFVDVIARQMTKKGFDVVRVPLLLVPVTALDDDTLDHEAFLLSWNNVVLQRRGSSVAAEGFASLITPLDERVRRLFADKGVSLQYLPPLVGSIVRDGGYRCASNHVREFRVQRSEFSVGH